MTRRLEVCVETVDGVFAAERGGADRIELCSDLLEGGISPSHGLVAEALTQARLPIFVMIRPRAGDFVYNARELDVMGRDIEVAREMGAAGVVLGVLRVDGTVDVPHTRELLARARPLEVTFHRAFDMTRDLSESLDSLLDLGIERVLTSGGARGVPEGIERIAELVARADGRLTVMPGGGITEKNLQSIVVRTGATEFHVSARGLVSSPMRHRNEVCSMGSAGDEYLRRVTDEDRVKAIAGLLART